ncbi:acetylglutamate kinase [Streptomyces mesophilus]|uniref:acetylglutamate kinase n=1 Tax=Streptomyces mesophilus TaxID=1775132 RepID=UPI00333453EE
MTAPTHLAQLKANAIDDALPWLARHQGHTLVIKLGGHAMVDESLTAAFARDIVFLRCAGLRPVVVHGGGPQIDAELALHGLTREFRAGLRITSPLAMDVVRMTLSGRLQRELVGLINQFAPLAVGMTGEDADSLTARRHQPWIDGEPVDIGRVGEIVEVRTGAIEDLLSAGRIPVISPLARSVEDGQVYNVNADTVAAALATALGAQQLIMLTDVAGLYEDWPHSDKVVERLTISELEKLLPELSSGMVPKMTGCLDAVKGGVGAARVIDGRVAHAVLLPMFPGDGFGTVVVPDPEVVEVLQDNPFLKAMTSSAPRSHSTV